MAWDGIDIFDPRMEALLRPDSKLAKHCTGCVWSEGAVYFSEGDYVLWSDIPNNRMMRWSEAEGMSVWREPSNFTNGHTRDLQGRLVSCEHGGRRVTRTESDGSITVLVDTYQGNRLNSPNDVVVKSDGTIWFTDPPYGIMSNVEGYQAESELEGNFVYRFDPESKDLTIVADDFDKPNGLCFSPDERLLYIADTGASHDENGPHHIRVFDVVDGTSLANGRLFADIEPGLADGFRVDVNGNVFTSSEDSIQVYEPGGTRLGKIMVPEKIANCTFGGPNKDRLFIVASSSLYSIMLATKGVQHP
ncbi:MAG: SMP-30/gluconolactonase/LRE family protein [Pseudomonadota bacterium]